MIISSAWFTRNSEIARYEVQRSLIFEFAGPEIWAQTGGKIDGFICAIGTGGTLAGTGQVRNSSVSLIGVIGHKRRRILLSRKFEIV